MEPTLCSVCAHRVWRDLIVARAGQPTTWITVTHTRTHTPTCVWVCVLTLTRTVAFGHVISFPLTRGLQTPCSFFSTKAFDVPLLIYLEIAVAVRASIASVERNTGLMIRKPSLVKPYYLWIVPDCAKGVSAVRCDLYQHMALKPMPWLCWLAWVSRERPSPMLISRISNGQKFYHICFLAAAVGHDIQDPERFKHVHHLQAITNAMAWQGNLKIQFASLMYRNVHGIMLCNVGLEGQQEWIWTNSILQLHKV